MPWALGQLTLIDVPFRGSWGTLTIKSLSTLWLLIISILGRGLETSIFKWENAFHIWLIWKKNEPASLVCPAPVRSKSISRVESSQVKHALVTHLNLHYCVSSQLAKLLSSRVGTRYSIVWCKPVGELFCSLGPQSAKTWDTLDINYIYAM